MTLSVRERAQLKNLLLEVGPDAPTCCEGWRTRELAAHLLLRETRPVAASGMFLGLTRDRLDKSMDELVARDYEDNVRQWGRGPAGPAKLFDRYVNAAEHFVHHEDVRRAKPFEPRALSKESQRELYSALKVARRMLSKSKVRVILRPEGEVAFPVLEAGARNASKKLVVTGPVSEVLLWVFGRPAVGLDFFGDPADAVRTTL